MAMSVQLQSVNCTGTDTDLCQKARAVALDQEPRALFCVKVLALSKERALKACFVWARELAGLRHSHHRLRARVDPPAADAQHGRPAADPGRRLDRERNRALVGQLAQDLDVASDRVARDDLALALDPDHRQERVDEVVRDRERVRGWELGGGGRGGGGGGLARVGRGWFCGWLFGLSRVEDDVLEEEGESEVPGVG